MASPAEDLNASTVSPVLDSIHRKLAVRDSKPCDVHGTRSRLAVTAPEIGDIVDEILTGPSFQGQEDSPANWLLVAHWHQNARDKLHRISAEVVVGMGVVNALIEHCERHRKAAHSIALGARHAS